MLFAVTDQKFVAFAVTISELRPKKMRFLNTAAQIVAGCRCKKRMNSNSSCPWIDYCAGAGSCDIWLVS